MASQTLVVGECLPVQQRAIPSAVGELDRAVSDLEIILSDLAAQLYPILDEDMTAGDGEKCRALPADNYQYSSQISELAARIRALTTRGKGLSQRLHV